MNTLLVAVILVSLTATVMRFAWSALVAVARMAAHGITVLYLWRTCGSRARANRLVRAVESETRNNAFSQMAGAPLSPRPALSAAARNGRTRLAQPVSAPRKLTVGSVTR